MNNLFSLIVYTANILGSFQDPFEFQGDYGPEVNPIRERVFELVVAKESICKNLSDFELKKMMGNEVATESDVRSYRQILLNQARELDIAHGPTFTELVTSDVIDALVQKQEEFQSNGFCKNDLAAILSFIKHHGDKAAFYFFRNAPAQLLTLDKTLRDKASREEKTLDLPILSSIQKLQGKYADELKINLTHALFTEEILSLTSSEDKLRSSISQLGEDFLKPFFGNDSSPEELQVFSTPYGQIFFYWLYQCLNLHLISEDPQMIEEINRVKEIFSRTLGDSTKRAEMLKEKLIIANSSVLFTQESDATVPQVLVNNGLFLPVDKQNPADGTFVFLRSDLWEPNYEVIPLKGYEGSAKGRVNAIFATTYSGEKFLLASAHGNSTRAEDGRLQLTLLMEQFEKLAQMDSGLQLIIGIDANTKSEEDIEALREHLDALGLAATNLGPTTIKQRMVTVQHAKAGRLALDEEDYLIILKPEKGGRFFLTRPTVGFCEEKPDISTALPNVNNPSDHYPVGATLIAK